MSQIQIGQVLFGIVYNYRPQRSCGQGNIFTPVCHSVYRGRGSVSVHAGIPPWEQTPPEQKCTPPPAPPPPGADTPSEQTPPGSRHPHTPPPEADSSIRSTSGRYASYWNAFLLVLKAEDNSVSHKYSVRKCVFFKIVFGDISLLIKLP